MKISNLMIALASALVGGLLVVLFAGTPGETVTAGKSDRLGGPTTETAFLPERFGVPSMNQ